MHVSHCFDRREHTARHVRYKRRVCMQILTHEPMTVCSFKHNFPFVYPMRRVSTKLYQLRHVTTCKLHHLDLRGRVHVQLLTYVDMSERKLSIVLTAGLWDVLTLKRGNSTLRLDLRKRHAYVQQFTCHTMMFHLPSHRYTWIIIERCDFLTYKSFSMWHFWHMKPCLSTLIRLVRRNVRLVYCKKTRLYTNFWLTRTCPCANFSHRRTCLYVTCHLISHVLSRQPCFHTKGVVYETCDTSSVTL